VGGSVWELDLRGQGFYFTYTHTLHTIHRLLSESLRESFRQGPFAATQDVTIYQNPWGFELANIRKRIHLWHGDADRIVPCCHSEFVHSQLADSELSIVPNEGHFSLPILHAEEILTTLGRPA